MLHKIYNLLFYLYTVYYLCYRKCIKHKLIVYLIILKKKQHLAGKIINIHQNLLKLDSSLQEMKDKLIPTALTLESLLFKEKNTFNSINLDTDRQEDKNELVLLIKVRSIFLNYFTIIIGGKQQQHNDASYIFKKIIIYVFLSEFTRSSTAT